MKYEPRKIQLNLFSLCSSLIDCQGVGGTASRRASYMAWLKAETKDPQALSFTLMKAKTASSLGGVRNYSMLVRTQSEHWGVMTH